MLSKAHLTLHSRMSGSRWVITPSWVSGSWRYFLYSYSVYSCHLFLISSASVRSIPFLSFIVPIFAWNVPLISLIFLKRSLVFPILLFSFTSLNWSLGKAFLSLLAILWNSAFKWVYLSFSPLPFTSLLFTAICKASSDNLFAFLHFFFLGMVFTPDKIWSTGEGNGKPNQYSCLENPMNSMKRQKDKTLKDNSPGRYVPNMLLQISGELQKEWRDKVKAKPTPSCGCDWWWK